MKKYGIIFALILVVMSVSGAKYYSKERVDPLKDYREKLKEINNELGTSPFEVSFG